MHLDMHLASEAVWALLAANICTGFCAKVNCQRLEGVSYDPMIPKFVAGLWLRGSRRRYVKTEM